MSYDELRHPVPVCFFRSIMIFSSILRGKKTRLVIVYSQYRQFDLFIFKFYVKKTYSDVEVNVWWNKHCFIQAFSIFAYELPEE